MPVTTPKKLMEAEIWDEACDLLGLNVWCVNEGTMDYEEEIVLTMEEAQNLGLIIP